MRKLLIFIFALLSTSAFAQVPPVLRIPFTTNAATHGKSTFVSGTYGNDVTGRTNSLMLPYRTIGAAKTNSPAGYTIFVGPGTYSENNLAKSNVNYHFYPGVVVSNRLASSAVAGWGIFDDRPTGAAGPMVISGAGEFVFANSATFNESSFGCVVVTNPITDLKFQCAKITISSPSGPTAIFCGVYVSNCRKVFIDIEEITDLFNTWSGGSDPGTGTGVYWADGPMWATVKKIESLVYCVWADEPVRTVTNSFYFTGQSMYATNLDTGSAALYVTSQGSANSQYRVWVECEEIIGGAAGAALNGSAKVYVTAQKISAIDPVNGQAIYNESELWMTCNKVQSSGLVIFRHAPSSVSPLTSRPAHLTIQHYEDVSLGGQDGVYNTSTNDLFLHGGLIKGGTNYQALVKHTGTGRTILENVTVDGASGASTNAPVLVSGNGLVAKNASVIAGAGKAIHANSAGAVILDVQGASYVNRSISSTIIASNGWLQVSNVMLALTPIAFPSGSNQRAGNLTLVTGTKTIANTTVTANTIIMLTRKTSGGTLGNAITYTLSAGTSFTVNSDSALDTSTFSYLLVENP